MKRWMRTEHCGARQRGAWAVRRQSRIQPLAADWRGCPWGTWMAGPGWCLQGGGEVPGAPGEALGMVNRPVWLDKALARKPSSTRLGKICRKTIGNYRRLLNGRRPRWKRY